MEKKKKSTGKALARSIVKQFVSKQGYFKTLELRDELIVQGWDFGTTEEKVNFAEMQMTRQFVQQLLTLDGKREYYPTKDQLSLGFEEMNDCFYPAESIRKKPEQKEISILWVRNQLAGFIARCSVIPEWAAKEMIKAINDVFEKIKKVA